MEEIMKRKLAIPFLFVLFSLVLAACGGAAFECTDEIGCVDIAEGDPVKIASLQALSGELASLGTDQVRAIELAIADAGGEVHGHAVTLQSEDDLCSAEGGTTGATKIVSDPQVVGIIGTSCSGAGVPASQIMSEAGLVMVSGSNTSPALTSIGGTAGTAWQPGYYRTAHNDTIQGRAAAEFAFVELGVTKAASIHDGDPYTQGLTSVFDQVFQELGGELVLATAVNKGDTDMRPVLTSVAAEGAELVFFPIFQPEGDFIVLQSKEIDGFEDITLMGADGLLSDTFVESVGDDGVGMYFSGPETPSGQAYADLVADYEAAYGEAPIQSFHGQAYDALSVVLAAIEGVGVLDDDGTLHIGRQALRDALYATRDFTGVTGSYTCDSFGDCAAPTIDVVQLSDPSAGLPGLRSNVVYEFTPLGPG
jgi:branched-chain amino acid transport system substrate-binding protein